MRNKALKGMVSSKSRRTSPLRKNYDFTKKREIKDGKIGRAVANAVTPKSLVDVIPTSKVVKTGKALYNLLTS